MEERDTRDTAATSRSLNVVHYIERDLESAARLVAGVAERGGDQGSGPNFLAILPTPDDVLSFGEVFWAHRRAEPRVLAPITSIARGRRVLSTGAAAIAGAPSDLARLVGESRLSLAGLQTLVLVWPEELLDDAEQRALLEGVLAEVPRTAERIAICAARSTELGQFLERSMWRARAVDHATPVPATASAGIRVLTASPGDRLRALRTVLDAFDPETATLMAFSDEGEAAAQRAAGILGSDGAWLRVSRGVPAERASLGIIFDDVPPAEALDAAAAMVNELVAIVRPSHLAALHKVASHATPMTWTGALANARSTHDLLRDEIRSYTSSGGHLPWVPIVEPLLDGLDAVEVAAAALSLLDRERRKAKRVSAVPQVPAPVAAERSREGRPSGFVGRPGAKRGETRDDRPERGFAKKRPSGSWGGAGGGKRRDEEAPRGPVRDRPERGRRDESAPGRERRGRRDDIERVPRAAREGREWSERGERLRHSRRGPRDGEAR